MFSVDNFYDFFVSDYGNEKTENLVMLFQPHGAKDLHNLEPFGVDLTKLSELEHLKTIYGRIIMHDQEPLFIDHFDTYKHRLANQKNLIIANERQAQRAQKLSQYPDDITGVDFLKKSLKTQKCSIICHSEKNSDDIKMLENRGFVTCYYWWHGMIARDWFRHWQHYADLQCKDKSLSDKRFLLYARATDGTRIYRKHVIEHCQQYRSIISYDWSGRSVDSSYSAKIDVNDSNSPIQLIAETLYETDKIYLTEKVFKPMVMSQAFILFGPPRSLEYLKDYGFQTFNQCWDESYDLESDHIVRMKKLLKLIDSLAKMPKNQFKKIFEKAIPIIAHNRNRFFSQEFQDDLILEMRTNMAQALFKQYQRHEHCLDDKSRANGNDVQ